jgi:hypothetical protein
MRPWMVESKATQEQLLELASGTAAEGAIGRTVRFMSAVDTNIAPSAACSRRELTSSIPGVEVAPTS